MLSEWRQTLQTVYTTRTPPVLFQAGMHTAERLLSLSCSYGRPMRRRGNRWEGFAGKVLGKETTVGTCPARLSPCPWKAGLMAGAAAAISDHDVTLRMAE